MEDYPRTLADFERRFRSEEACRDYLFRVRWPEGFRCPRCGESRAWRLRSALWQCANCAYQASLTAGTIFQRSEEHTSELQSRGHLVCRLLLEKKKKEIRKLLI